MTSKSCWRMEIDGKQRLHLTSGMSRFTAKVSRTQLSHGDFRNLLFVWTDRIHYRLISFYIIMCHALSVLHVGRARSLTCKITCM